MAIKIQAQIQWRAVQSSTSERWIGMCDSMQLSIEAESLDELHSVIDETMTLVFTDLLRENELDRYLAERGWMAVPATEDGEEIQFAVPWELIAAGSHDSSRRVHQHH